MGLKLIKRRNTLSIPANAGKRDRTNLEPGMQRRGPGAGSRASFRGLQRCNHRFPSFRERPQCHRDGLQHTRRLFADAGYTGRGRPCLLPRRASLASHTRPAPLQIVLHRDCEFHRSPPLKLSHTRLRKSPRRKVKSFKISKIKTSNPRTGNPLVGQALSLRRPLRPPLKNISPKSSFTNYIRLIINYLPRRAP